MLEELSKRLTDRLGNGWSYSNLRQIRQFYLVYGNLTTSGYQIEDARSGGFVIHLRAVLGFVIR